MDRTAALNHRAIHILALTLLCLILFFFQLGSYSLWDVDEGKHASTSKNMVLSGDWITPKYNGENFYDKPALFNWLAAISFLLFGFTEFAARLPAALLGWGGVITTYYLGRKIFHHQAGFLSAVILATSVEYIALSRVVVHDISLTFFMTLALTLFYIGYQSEKKRRRNFLFGYAALGLAFLAKGPVGLMLPAMVIGLFLILKRNIGFLKEMQLGWGILLFFAVAAPWYILISIRNPDYFEYFFIKQNFGSFFGGESSRHPESIDWYLQFLFGGFLPWSLFLPLALYDAIRRKLKTGDGKILYILIWFVAIFVFFSLGSSKRGSYILPLFPALSLLVGVFLNDLMVAPNRAYHRVALCSFVPVAAIFPLALIYLWLFPPYEIETQFGFYLIQLKYILILATGITVFAFYALLKRKYPIFLFSVTALVISMIVVIFLFIMPAIDPYRTTKGPGLKLDEILEPDDDLLFYGREKASVLFYTNRKVVSLNYQQLRNLMNSDKTAYCIISREDWEEELKDSDIFARIFFEDGDRMIISNLKSGR